MGLIKAAAAAIGSTMGDQWQDLIRCDNLDNDTLMVKQTTSSGQISKGSRIIVAPGQVAVIYDSGSIVDATAEEGTYTFDQSTSPSFFGGQFGDVFKEMWQRFTYNGTPAKEQAVFYFNVKEIVDNKFGTAQPVPFQDWGHAIPNQMLGTLMPMAVRIKCYGKYTFKINDPAVFMREFAGTESVVKKETLLSQMTSEVSAAFQNILNELGNSEHKVPAMELRNYSDEIKQIMDERTFDEPIRNRGIKLVGFLVESVTPDDDSLAKFEEYEHNANSMMQQGRVLDVMETAAGNANGAANGFVGLGVMNMASGGMTGGVMQNAFGQPGQGAQQGFDPYAKNQTAPATPVAPAPAAEGTPCPKCGTVSTGKFCYNCGASMEAPAAPAAPVERKCPNCGATLLDGAKFCVECGTSAEPETPAAPATEAPAPAETPADTTEPTA